MLTKEQVNFSDYRVIDLKEKHSVRTIGNKCSCEQAENINNKIL